MKTIRVPSGDQRGDCAASVVGLTCRRFWPSRSTTQMDDRVCGNGPPSGFEPYRKNAIRPPSGESVGAAPPAGDVEFSSATSPLARSIVAMAGTNDPPDASAKSRTKTMWRPSKDSCELRVAGAGRDAAGVRQLALAAASCRSRTACPRPGRRGWRRRATNPRASACRSRSGSSWAPPPPASMVQRRRVGQFVLRRKLVHFRSGFSTSLVNAIRSPASEVWPSAAAARAGAAMPRARPPRRMATAAPRT